MSLGGFRAVVRVLRAEVSAGFSDPGHPVVAATMELERRILEFHYKELKTSIQQYANRIVDVDVDFTQKQESHDRYGQWGAFIGGIHVTRKEPTELRVYLALSLPLSMFSLLQSVEQRELQLDTIHNLVLDPNEEQRTDSIVALVKRVYFQPLQAPTPERRLFSFGGR